MLAPPAHRHPRGLTLLLVEVSQFKGVFQDVAAREYARDLLVFVKVDQRLQAEPTVANDKIQQKVPGTFHAPLAEVDGFGDGAVKEVEAAGGPGCGVKKCLLVNLLGADDLANAKAVIGQEVSKHAGEIVEAAETAVHVDAELAEAGKLSAGADVHADQRQVVVVRCSSGWDGSC